VSDEPVAPGPQDPAVWADLADWGKVALLETHGRRTGRRISTPVGFIEEPDRSLLVAASDESTQWARNLAADPRCRVTLEGITTSRVAERLDAAGHDATVVALILRYGTPAEKLGAGPAFRLRSASRPPGA
jgi:deazaflavin-dependent oxidoreductase (nitroreductase family)